MADDAKIQLTADMAERLEALVTASRREGRRLSKTEAVAKALASLEGAMVTEGHDNLPPITVCSASDEATDRFQDAFEKARTEDAKRDESGFRVKFIPAPVSTMRGQGGPVCTIDDDDVLDATNMALPTSHEHDASVQEVGRWCARHSHKDLRAYMESPYSHERDAHDLPCFNGCAMCAVNLTQDRIPPGFERVAHHGGWAYKCLSCDASGGHSGNVQHDFTCKHFVPVTLSQVRGMGSDMFSFEEPAFTPVGKKYAHFVITVCPVCMSISTKMCGGCRKKKYCSRDCQRQDWPRHRLKCVAATLNAIKEKE